MIVCLIAAAGEGGAQVVRGAPPLGVPAGEVREHHLTTPSLGVRKRYRIYLPPSYERDSLRRYPVAYYLHGLYGDENNWVDLGRLDRAMDSLVATGMPEFIVVMPDGDDGWYTTWNTLPNVARCRAEPPPNESADQYCAAWPRYDDYIARDLVQHVDSTWRTLARRDHRGIGGLSMGGFGAVTLAVNYPELFAAAASHSGALGPLWRGRPGATQAPVLDSVARRWGATAWPHMVRAFGRDTLGWLARDPTRRAVAAWSRDAARFPVLFADVGIDDPLLTENRRFRDAMREAGAPLEYREWPGAHSWTYWRTHVPESLFWMSTQIAPR